MVIDQALHVIASNPTLSRANSSTRQDSMRDLIVNIKELISVEQGDYQKYVLAIVLYLYWLYINNKYIQNKSFIYEQKIEKITVIT